MSRVGTKLLATALLTAAAAAGAQETSLNRAGSGARAAGMGNAFIAVSDDGTAASWNPAGLSQLRKPEFSLVQSTSGRTTFLEGYKARDDSAFFTTLKSSATTTDIEFASAAVPFGVAGKPVTLQVGWRRLYQLNARLRGDMRRVPSSPTSRPEGVVRLDGETNGSIDLWSFAGAARLTSRLSLGFSLDLYRGDWEDSANTSEDPGVAGPTDFSSVRITNSVRGENLTLGLLLGYPKFRVGMVYHGALLGDYAVSQTTLSSLTDPFEARFENGPQIHFPRSIGVGVAWLPKPLLRLAVDVTYDQWTQFLVVGSPNSPDQPTSGFDGLPPELSATRDTITVNAGIEKLFPVNGQFVPLRFGWSREPQGGRDPLVRDDSNHRILAAGTGLNSNSVKLDVSVEYRWGDFGNTLNLTPVYVVGRAADFGLPPGPEVQGKARIQEWRVKVSLIYRVTNTDKAKDVLKKIFGS